MLLGSIPFGLLLTRAVRRARHPFHRLRQHRRDQRAAHRPQGPRRRDPARRHAQRHRRGARSRGYLFGRDAAHRRRPGRLSRSPVFRCGSGSRAARASRPSSACCSAFSWVAVLIFAVHLDRRSPLLTRYSSLSGLVACAATPRRLVGAGHTGGRRALFHAGAPRLHHAPRQHRAADGRAQETKIGQSAVKP